MSTQSNKESSVIIRAAIIGGVFAVIAACVAGVFPILNTFIDKTLGTGNANPVPTTLSGPTNTRTVVPTTASFSTPTDSGATIVSTQTPVVQPAAVSTDYIPATMTATPKPVATVQRVATVPPALSGFTRANIDKMLGQDNWFCVPDRQDLVIVKNFPQGFVVSFPFVKVDTSNGKSFTDGQVVLGVYGTAWMSDNLPINECPVEQQLALADWVTKSSQPITRELIDSVLQGTGWRCNGSSWSIMANDAQPGWVVQYPFTSADFTSGNYGVGQVVSGGGVGTLHMVRVPKELCP